MTRIIALANQKGGVGKTMSTFHLGGGLARHGKRVLAVDLDPQASLSEATIVDYASLETFVGALLLRLENTPHGELEKRLLAAIRPADELGIDILPGDNTTDIAENALKSTQDPRRALDSLLRLIHGHYDYILIDCPPRLELITQNGLSAAQSLIIPIATDVQSLRSSLRFLTGLGSFQRSYHHDLQILRVVPTRFDGRRTHHREALEAINENFPKVAPTPIHEAAALEDAVLAGQSIFQFSPTHRAAMEYGLLLQDVIGHG